MMTSSPSGSDVFATFAEFVGQKQIPQGMAEDSVNFLPYLLDANKSPESRSPIVGDKSTLRDGDWKLMLPRRKRAIGEKESQRVEGDLYNLRVDRNEKHNQAGQEPDRVKRTRMKLESILATSQPVAQP